MRHLRGQTVASRVGELQPLLGTDTSHLLLGERLSLGGEPPGTGGENPTPSDETQTPCDETLTLKTALPVQ